MGYLQYGQREREFFCNIGWKGLGQAGRVERQDRITLLVIPSVWWLRAQMLGWFHTEKTESTWQNHDFQVCIWIFHETEVDSSGQRTRERHCLSPYWRSHVALSQLLFLPLSWQIRSRSSFRLLSWAHISTRWNRGWECPQGLRTKANTGWDTESSVPAAFWSPFFFF